MPLHEKPFEPLLNVDSMIYTFGKINRPCGASGEASEITNFWLGIAKKQHYG